MEFLNELKPSHEIEVQVSRDGVAIPAEFVVSMTLHKNGLLGIDSELERLRNLSSVAAFLFIRIKSGDEVIEKSELDMPLHWWVKKIMRNFELQTVQRVPGGVYFIVFPKSVEIVH